MVIKTATINITRATATATRRTVRKVGVLFTDYSAGKAGKCLLLSISVLSDSNLALDASNIVSISAVCNKLNLMLSYFI